jgi:hypothetical protein
MRESVRPRPEEQPVIRNIRGRLRVDMVRGTNRVMQFGAKDGDELRMRQDCDSKVGSREQQPWIFQCHGLQQAGLRGEYIASQMGSLWTRNRCLQLSPVCPRLDHYDCAATHHVPAKQRGHHDPFAGPKPGNAINLRLWFISPIHPQIPEDHDVGPRLKLPVVICLLPPRHRLVET